MNVKIQIYCIFLSLVYGFFIRCSLLINLKLNKFSSVFKVIIDLLYVYIIVLLYTLIIYYINNGIFHVYFLFLILIGYIISNKYVNFTISVLKKVKYKLIK